jgi:hypothetical protein
MYTFIENDALSHERKKSNALLKRMQQYGNRTSKDTPREFVGSKRQRGYSAQPTAVFGLQFGGRRKLSELNQIW